MVETQHRPDEVESLTSATKHRCFQGHPELLRCGLSRNSDATASSEAR